MQIHKEAEREKTQNQLLNQMTQIRNRDDGPRGMGPGPNDRKKSGRGANPASEDGWQSAQPSKSSQRSFDRIDTNKISNLAQSSTRRVSSEAQLHSSLSFYPNLGYWVLCWVVGLIRKLLWRFLRVYFSMKPFFIQIAVSR